MDEVVVVTKEQGESDGSARMGPYRLGRSHEMGPGLGRVYEAWHSDTGAATLLLIPDEQVDWRPSGDWKVTISYHSQMRALVAEVQDAPASFDVTELVNLLVMVSAVVERLEENPQVQAHFALPPKQRNLSRAPSLGVRTPRARRAAALVGLAMGAFVLALGLWFYFSSGHGRQEVAPSGFMSEQQTPTNALHQIDTRAPGGPVVATPMPTKPFDNQMLPPCYPDLGEVEINGGCWVELARRAPCLKIQSEHQGKCYLSVMKRKDIPNSIHPGETAPAEEKPLR